MEEESLHYRNIVGCISVPVPRRGSPGKHFHCLSFNEIEIDM